MWGWNSLEPVRQDVRYALRTMGRTPGFTAVAVLSLALGIGANTAIFSLIDTLMLPMLPVREPEQLVELLDKYPGEPRGSFFPRGSYEHFRDQNHVFSGLIGVNASGFSVRGPGGEPEATDGECVTGSFFPVLGVKPAIGRLLGPEDDHAGAAGAAAVVSWSYWRNRFNLDPAIVGKRIVVEDTPVTIVGVTPREFIGLQVGSRPDLWLPPAMEPVIHRPSRIGRGGLRLMGRLKPGTPIGQARAEMSVLFRWTIEERTKSSKDPLLRQLSFEMEPAGAGFSLLRDRFAQPL
jgi:putative ABC transport system permease protein